MTQELLLQRREDMFTTSNSAPTKRLTFWFVKKKNKTAEVRLCSFSPVKREDRSDHLTKCGGKAEKSIRLRIRFVM